MVDQVNKATRNKIMAANRSKDTGPELIVRKALFSKGLRYRIHYSRLPGKPDIVLIKYRVAIFVHGCFWHGHKCNRKPHAKSNTKFWQKKIEANKQRDLKARYDLLMKNWRILVIWECAVRRRKIKFCESSELHQIVSWLSGLGKLASISENGFEEYL